MSLSEVLHDTQRQIETAAGEAGPVERAVDTKEAARILGVGVSSMEKWRLKTGDGPPYRKFGRRVTYLPSELREWRDQHKRRSTSELPDDSRNGSRPAERQPTECRQPEHAS